jgi:hypothetical protein
MAQPTPSGSIVSKRDIIAHTINTGQIAQHTHLTLNVIVERLDQLAGILAQADSTLRLSASGALEVAAGTQVPLSLSDNLLEALRLLSRADDASVDVRRRAYAPGW